MTEMAVATHDCICEKPLQRYQSTGIEFHNFNCPQRHAAGIECHTHFEMRDVMQWQVDECIDCQNAHKENIERIQRTQTIDPNQPYGQHIALMCKNHPSKRWHTKNIDWIGARTIFFSSDLDHDHEKNPTYVPHSLLNDGVYGPIWMNTPCSMRREFFGSMIDNTPLDCECDCPTSKLVAVKNS